MVEREDFPFTIKIVSKIRLLDSFDGIIETIIALQRYQRSIVLVCLLRFGVSRVLSKFPYSSESS
jgi:hypothetical protein